MKQVESELELPRLSESDEPGLARLVAGLRDNRPDAAELGSLASQLAVRGIGVTVPAPPPSPSRPSWKKWALVGGGVASVLGLGFGFRELPTSLSRSPGATPSVVAASPLAMGSRLRRGVATRPGVVDPTAPAVSAPPAAAPSDTAENPSAGALPSSPGKAEAPSHSERASARNEPASRRTPSVGATSSADTSAPPELAVPTEIELLRDARLALKQSPARALELAESHARAYPGGKLAQERELMAITALVALGRRTAALGRASRFEQSFPQSPYRKQIGELLR